MTKYSLLFIALIFFYSCGSLKNYEHYQERELRGVWIATVANIDWPKQSKDDVDKKKQDYIEILDFYKQLNFNAVIVQIRTAGDAFYPSTKAPWSRFLTGQEGHAEPPYNNFLEWMINQAHSRGLEFHAWVNPYRATIDDDLNKLSKQHDVFTHSEWMIKYGKKYYYNPGNPEVISHIADVIKEIVINYDIDAIHFDDYFYPYKIKDETFDDLITYHKYKRPKQSIDDWRRSNIDSLVSKTYKSIQDIKPWVQFGISPFGVWKNKENDPKGSDTHAGQTSYEDLYADPLSWIENKWIDYLVPQIYWSMDFEKASHRKLLKWWSINSYNTNLYIGNGSYKIRNNSDSAWFDKNEMLKQLKLARNTSAVSGNVFFSAKSLRGNNTDIAQMIKSDLFRRQVLTPVSPLDTSSKRINKPKIETYRVSKDSIHITFKDINPLVRYLLIYQEDAHKKKVLKKKVFFNNSKSYEVVLKRANFNENNKFYFHYLDKYRKKSKAIQLKIKS